MKINRLLFLMNKIIYPMLWVFFHSATQAEGLPDENNFHQRFVQMAVRKIEVLEQQNRENLSKGQPLKNQYLVYINCTDLMTPSQLAWVGSLGRSIEEQQLTSINENISVNFDAKYNKAGQKKIRFYILFVDNYPVSLTRDTDVKGYSDLSEADKSSVKAVEALARPKLGSAIKEIFNRASDLEQYEEWVAHTIGTVVGVTNVKGRKRKVVFLPMADSRSDGRVHFVASGKGKCFLRNSINGYGKVSGEPLERLRLRASQMQQWLGSILENKPDYLSNNCQGTGDGAGNSIVINFSKQAFDNEDLKKLLNGEKKYTDAQANEWRAIKVKIFLTDATTTPVQEEQISKYTPSANEKVARLHFDGTQWVLQSSDTQATKDLSQAYTGNGLKGLSFNDFLAGMRELYKQNPLDNALIGLYSFFDSAEKFISKAKIPESVWNCNSKDPKNVYDPFYADVFGYLVNPLGPLVNKAVLPLINKLDPANTDAKAFTTLVGTSLDQANRVQFALVCG
ncbi:MAG: hypothetical protein H7Y04_06115, partial [Verrucomicrobia bacterium]|nr:hypothetical protein [Cytophagales bacterium]